MAVKIQALVAIVTGGASGIGASTVAEFLAQGWAVVIADRNLPGAEAIAAAARKAGHQAVAIHVDIADEASVQQLVDQSVEHFGKVDAAVHAAGIGGPSLPVHEIPTKAWQQVQEIDLAGSFYFSRALVKYWLSTEPRLIRDDTAMGLGKVYQRGSLAVVASVNGSFASVNMGGYVSAKHGVKGLVKNIALENVDSGIRANMVSPGCTYTPIMQADNFNFEDVKVYLTQQAAKRFAHPDEIAPALVFLCSDDASFCTGSDINLDAGWSAH